MAARKYILEILRILEEYYRQQYNPTQVRILLRQLAQIPDYLLHQVVDHWLDTEDNWLPRGSQLLKLALKISGFPDITLIPPEPPIAGSPIWVQHQALKDQYYRRGLLDPSAWNALITQAESDNLPLTTATLQRSLDSIQNPKTPPVCAQYADWNHVS
jgi:hypothetical protein